MPHLTFIAYFRQHNTPFEVEFDSLVEAFLFLVDSRPTQDLVAERIALRNGEVIMSGSDFEELCRQDQEACVASLRQLERRIQHAGGA